MDGTAAAEGRDDEEEEEDPLNFPVKASTSRRTLVSPTPGQTESSSGEAWMIRSKVYDEGRKISDAFANELEARSFRPREREREKKEEDGSGRLTPKLLLSVNTSVLLTPLIPVSERLR